MMKDRVYPRVMVYFFAMMIVVSAWGDQGWTTVVFGVLTVAWFWILSLTYLGESVD